MDYWLDENQPTAAKCYRGVIDWTEKFYPELVESIPSLRTFQRHIENDIKYAVKVLMRDGEKAFNDRCLPYMLPYSGNVAENKEASFHELRDEAMHEKRLLVITTCGYVSAEPMYPALTKQLDLICGNGNYTMIKCPEGELFIAEKAERQRKAYLDSITEAGREFCENRCLCDETMRKISKPILSPKGFEAITKAHWKMS